MCIANINFLNRFLIIYFYTEIKSHAEPILYSIKNIIFSISYINLQQCSMKYAIVPDTFLNITNH